jgi:hypothetical protein
VTNDGRLTTIDYASFAPEHERASQTTIRAAADPSRQQVRFQWALGSEARMNPFAALAWMTPSGLELFNGVTFGAVADRPMRVSVQLRTDGATGDRWQRSVYIDQMDATHTIRFDDLTPLGGTFTAGPPLKEVRGLLFVVDTSHARAGSAGELRLHDLAFVR